MQKERILQINNAVISEVMEYSLSPGICEKLNWLRRGSFDIDKEEYYAMLDLYTEFKSQVPELCTGIYGGAYWFATNGDRLTFLREFAKHIEHGTNKV